MKNSFAVESDNRGGGIALYWDESLMVDVKSYSHRHIDVLIKENPTADAWRATFVYGEPRCEHRHRMWDRLRLIKQEVVQPWMVRGDFNEAAWQFEHFSESPRSENQMKAFRDMMEDCGLVDLGF